MRVIGTASRATPLPRPTTALQGELLRAQEDRLRACGGGHVGVSRRVDHVLREHHATAKGRHDHHALHLAVLDVGALAERAEPDVRPRVAAEPTTDLHGPEVAHVGVD